MAKQRQDETEQEVPLVTGANGRTRKPMQGDEAAPKCVWCSTGEHPVFCAAFSTRHYYTWYRCPVCGDRVKVPRYQQLKQIHRREPPEDYSAR